MEEISLEQLKEMEENLFQKQCDLDIQKAFVKHFIKKKELEQSSITAVSQAERTVCPYFRR
jgi:predicted transcriptional regulator